MFTYYTRAAVVAFALLLNACGSDGTTTVDSGATSSAASGATQQETLTGRISIGNLDGQITDETTVLPSGSVLIVSIDDTSLADAAAETLATRTYEDATLPLDFEVAWPDDREATSTYSLSARVNGADGELLYINDTAFDVAANQSNQDFHVIDVNAHSSEIDTNATTRLWISPELVDCVGVFEQKCMQIATSANGETEFFYDLIEGFDFVEGTAYVIDVVIEEIEDPPADGSSLLYTLDRIIEESTS